MKTLFRIMLVGLFLSTGSVYADKPCPRGIWVTLGVHTYCAPSLSDIQLMINVQRAVYDGQHSQNVTYRPLMANFNGTTYCRTIEFRICVMDASLPFDKPRDPGSRKAFQQLEQDEWEIVKVHRFDTGAYDLLIRDVDGREYHLEVDELGKLQYMGAKED